MDVLPGFAFLIPKTMHEQGGAFDASLWTAEEQVTDFLKGILRPGLLLAFFVAGWALNVSVFVQWRIDYCHVLSINKDEAVNPRRLFAIAAVICILVSFWRFILMPQAPPVVTLWSVLLAYLLAFGSLFVWLPSPLARLVRWRMPLAKALRRCLLPDLSREIPFVEVLVADGLTSLAKVFFDLTVGVCVAQSTSDLLSPLANAPILLALHSPHLPIPSTNGTSSTIHDAVPRESLRLSDAVKQCGRSPLPYLAWACPFLIRARQCLITASHAPDDLGRDLQRINFLKYLSALPIIIFALCYARSGFSVDWLIFGAEEFEALWAVSAVVNSIFSFLWDLVMDWGLLQPGTTRKHFGLRPVLLFAGLPGLYYFVIICNLLGRTLWSLRWSPQATVFLGTFCLTSLQQGAEVGRRCIWNVFRVEWECIKKNVHRKLDGFSV